ncbi:FAS1 domain-containing protein [Echria macrotheca]|uniref:FAS1 domain-containing protein n=1 Tax=Echria macrotheca TaxID=438768 RepID=A0AAJ0BBS2_9PEZI|nr:FAS1 domain-containing protein [Echria macrotheca]
MVSMWTLRLVLGILVGGITSSVGIELSGHHPGPWTPGSSPESPPTEPHEPPYRPPFPALPQSKPHETTNNYPVPPPPAVTYHPTESYHHVKTSEPEAHPPYHHAESHKPHPTLLPPLPPPPPPGPPSLDDALINAGCAKFLDFIKSDNDTWALYNSARVRTIFAPDDSSFDSNTTAARRLRRRDLTPAQQQAADLSADTALTDMSKLRLVPGAIVQTNDDSANLGGGTQVVVSEISDSGDVSISSGLGNRVSIKASDITYAGGLIQVTSGLFTPPQLLSLTALAGNDTTIFSSLLSSLRNNNLTRRQADTLDSTPRITVFIPTDAAFRSVGAIPGNAIAQVIAGHVVVSSGTTEPVGYLPALTNGQVLTTKGGGQLAIRVTDGTFYVGPARIEKPNLILPNGVAHVVDKVLSPIPIATAGAVPGASAGAHRHAFLVAGAVAAAMVI